MAGLIKNQILKHLTKFTKNLSPDKIHVSTLKGEGDLSNLELDEKVLTELLDLPTWLTITKAVCNRVAIKIQWTKLKTQPICVFLDEIEVEMETCENIRNPATQSPLADLSSGGKYGLAERIVDGMYVSINSVVVNFKARAFHASIQLSRIIIQSKTPIWERCGDLRLTRIKDELRGEILLFKEAEWQTLRIEANALDGSNLATTPLRLIANQSKIRITIKKRLVDCGIVASRLLINLDDLLWVLTDSQLKAALAFINSLKDVVQKSTQQSKLLAAEKIRKQGFTPSSRQMPTQHTATSGGKSHRAGSKSEQAISKLFHKYDIGETSYHLHSGRIDLHLCEDPSSDEEVSRKKVDGGAIQMTFLKMFFDYYPFHPAGAERTHWLKYDENMATRDSWASELLQTFREDVRKVRTSFSPQASPANETAPSATGAVSPDGKNVNQNQTQSHEPHSNQHPPTRPNHLLNATQSAANRALGNHAQQQKGAHHASFQAATKHTRLLENSFIFRIEDFVIFQVSSATDSRRRAPPKKFLSSEKKQLWLPQEMSSIHMEYTDYYFPEGIDFPGSVISGDQTDMQDKQVQSNVQGALDDHYLACVPHTNLYVVINPIKLTLDYLTLLWLNAFSLNISNSLNIPEQKGPSTHTDIRIDALMPRVVVPGEEQEYPEQIDRPTSLQLQMSRLTLTNCRLGSRSTRTDLKELLETYSKTKLLHKEEFPCCKKQLEGLPQCIVNHGNGTDAPYFDHTVEAILSDQELPHSFSNQGLEELLVNSYSQRKSSRSSSDTNQQHSDNTFVHVQHNQCKPATSSQNQFNSSSNISHRTIENQTNSINQKPETGDDEITNHKKKTLTNQDSVSSVGLTYYSMRTNSFKKNMRKDVWCAVIDQVWLEFLGAPSAGGRPLPLIESFPLTLWIAFPKASHEADVEHGREMSHVRESGSRATRSRDRESESGAEQRMERNDGHKMSEAIEFERRMKMDDGYKSADAEDSGNVTKIKNAEHLASDFSKKFAENVDISGCNGETAEHYHSEDGFTKKEEKQVTQCTADIHMIAKIGGQVHIQMSHYQYLFLMRLVETMTNFQNELQRDTEAILKKGLPQKNIGVSVMLQEVELAMICLPNKDEFANDDSSVDNSSDLTQEDTVTVTTQDIHQTPQRQSGQDSALGASFQSHRDGALNKSHSDTDLVSPSSSEEPPIDELVRQATTAMAASDTDLDLPGRKTSVPSYMPQQTTFESLSPSSRENSSPAICISDVGPSNQFYEPPPTTRSTPSGGSPAHHTHRKPGEMKKTLSTGISNLGNKFSSFGSKLKDKVNMNKRDFEMEEGEDWETVSTQSSDDEDYIMLKYQNEEELPAFDKQYGGVGEAGSDDNSQVMDGLANKNRGTVSVVTFKLFHVEAFVQMVGKDTKVAAQVDHVIPEELGNIELDKFQERFSAGTNTLHTDVPAPLAEAPIQLSFSQGPQAELLAPTAGERGFLHCKIHGLHIRLPMAGLTSLTDLIEDEKNSPVIPILAEITDSFITLEDSKNTTYATSVEKIPIDLHISKLAARRTEDAVFHLLGETLPADVSLDAKYWKQKCIQTTPSIEHPPTARTINYVSLGLAAPATTPRRETHGQEEERAGNEAEVKGLTTLQEENEQLRRQLERIGKLSSQTGGIDQKSLEALQKECDHLKYKANKADRLQRENRALMEQLTRQADDICTMKEERESLLATIQMLQEELSESENMRMAQRKS